jgi:hypothetical protein
MGVHMRGALAPLNILPPSLYQLLREGGQGDRSPIGDKTQTPRGRVGGRRCPRGVAGGGKNNQGRRWGENKREGHFYPSLYNLTNIKYEAGQALDH